MNLNSVNILTWNVQKKSSKELKTALKDAVQENDINIIVLQEAGNGVISDLLPEFIEVKVNDQKNEEKCTLRILIKQGIFEVQLNPYKGVSNKLFFVHLKQKGSTIGFNMAGVHLHSKVGSGENKDIRRMHKNTKITTEIKRLEKDVKFAATNRTILAGDFNANPYDNDLLDFDMIPAIQHKELLKMLTASDSIFPENIKVVDYWYNPMWNFMGDNNTYKNNNLSNNNGSYFLFSDSWARMWHLFDGFILRPSIMDCIDFSKSGILQGTNAHYFIKPNKNKNKYCLIDELLSDHLPVVISLHLD